MVSRKTLPVIEVIPLMCLVFFVTRGTPSAFLSALQCDPWKYFVDHQLVFTINLCGKFTYAFAIAYRSRNRRCPVGDWARDSYPC